MRAIFRLAIPVLLSFAAMAQRPWQQITAPSLREVAANFKTPPREYGAIRWLTNGGEVTQARILSDLEQSLANGVFVVNVGWGSLLKPPYLSAEQLALAKFAVEEASKRGMKVWLQDEGNYPSGFAGGRIIKEYPHLAMQGIVADMRIRVVPGQRLSVPVPSDTLAIFAEKASPGGQVQEVIPIPAPSGGELKWVVPNEGTTPNMPRYSWEVVFVRHIYISSPTRCSNREDGTNAKDALYSLIDYLDPEATRAFLSTTHEKYRQLFGGEFGKTVLGFFGDEPDYSGMMTPWTPRLLEEFQKQKGYDLRPYLAFMFSGKPTGESLRAKADYWDVWSGMFRESFFKVQADWCAANNVEYLVHLNHEESTMALIRSEGDFFRCMRYVHVPGIDNLNQLTPAAVHRPDGAWNINNNFPKLASSAAHLFGRPRVWSESAGGPDLEGKYSLDFQLVRGVNAPQIRLPLPGGGRPGSAPGEAAPAAPPQASMLAWYANRAGYLLATGRPAAQVALYYPSASMWLGDDEAARSMTKLGWQLLERQVDWDYIDDQSLGGVATLEGGSFRNLSGQLYRAVVVPSVSAIPQATLARLQAFAKSGGRVIFVGRTPKLLVERTFLEAKETPDVSFAVIEPSGDITDRVIQALPKPDVTLDSPCAAIKYTRRTYSDADVYFFFNESDEKQSRIATLAGRGQAQVWDAATGSIRAAGGATAVSDGIRLPLALGPYEARFIVIGPLPAGAAGSDPSPATGRTLLELSGDWTLDIAGKTLTTPLKSWEDLGISAFAGAATYRKEFTAPAAGGQSVFLEFDRVRDYARVRLNGVELEARAWQPYRWDVTRALRAGANVLEVEVRSSGVGRGFGGGAPPAGVPGAAPGQAPGGAPGAPPAGMAGRGGQTTPAVSGLLGPARLVAH